MPRPRLPVGELGKITTQTIGKRKARARARFRDNTGATLQIEAVGTSQEDAARNLRKRYMQRLHGQDNTAALTKDSTVTALSAQWLEEIAESDRVPQTVEQYRRTVHRHVLPGLGGLALWEVTVGRLDRHLKTIAADAPTQAKTTKTVLQQMFALAVRLDVLPDNPVKNTALPAAKAAAPKSLTVAEARQLRIAVRNYLAAPVTHGPGRPMDLADIIDVMLGTGCRIGEVAALRWSDVDLSTTPATLTVSGTAVRRPGVGLIRQGHAKTDKGYRTISLPQFVADVLLRRTVEVIVPNDGDLVFPSATGTLRETSNLERQWSDARKHPTMAGFEWVRFHTLRKTVATLITRATSDEDAAKVLGHAATGVTHRHYIERAHVAPDVSAALDAIGAVSENVG